METKENYIVDVGVESENTGKNESETAVKNSLSMKWYKFLIWFSLWVVMLALLRNAYYLLIGRGILSDLYKVILNHATFSDYFSRDVISEINYMMWEWREFDFNILFGTLNVMMIILLLFTWFGLKNRKKEGPILLLIYNGMSMVYQVGYSILLIFLLNNMENQIFVSHETGELIRMSNYIGEAVIPYVCSFVAAVIMLVVNYVYFKKRMDYFNQE